MLSEVEICNVAFGRIGVTQTIEDLGENTKEARTANRLYAHCRDRVLREFPWAWATKAVALSVVNGASFPGYGYVYGYPSDCILALNVCSADGLRQISDYTVYWYDERRLIPGRPAFKLALGANNASKVILTDIDDAYLIYVARVTDTTIYSSDFDSALAWLLASELALPMKADPKLFQNALNVYQFAKSQAKAQSLNEERPDMEPDSPSIAVRD